MRFRSVFLMSVLILLVAIVTAEKSTRASSPVVAHCGRLLRKVDVDEANALETEERGVWSSIKNWVKMQYWLAAGKSDDEVKKALKMEGLTGSALKSHPNYKKLEKFWYKRESRQMNGWFDEGISTQRVWDDLGLARMSADQRKDSDQLRLYVRYATKYDDEIWDHQYSMLEPPIYYGGSSAEMRVKVQIWAKAKRKDRYVKELLGLDGLSEAERFAHPRNKYFVEFLNLMKAKAATPNAAR